MDIAKMPCYYFSANDEGTILAVNETLCNQLGYLNEELCGKKLEKIFTIATSIFHQTHFFPLIKMQGYANEIFITLQTKSRQQVPVLVNAERQDSVGETSIQYIGIPVHNRKKFEDELIAAKKAAEGALQENITIKQLKQDLQTNAEHLEQSIVKVNQQNKELKQLNWIVTHDLQEPLRKLSLFSNLLVSKGNLDEELVSIYQRLIATSAKMRSVLSGVQQYVWLTEATTTLTTININDLLPGIRKKLDDEFPHVELNIELNHVPPIEADPEQIEVLLYQLLSNVVRFRKEGKPALVQIGGTILQKNSFTEVKEKYKYQAFVRLRVTDQGKGFNPASTQQAFELFRRFHTADSRGLGLSLCKKVVENHGGRISLDTTLDVGTTVTVLLPTKHTVPAHTEHA